MCKLRFYIFNSSLLVYENKVLVDFISSKETNYVVLVCFNISNRHNLELFRLLLWISEIAILTQGCKLTYTYRWWIIMGLGLQMEVCPDAQTRFDHKTKNLILLIAGVHCNYVTRKAHLLKRTQWRFLISHWFEINFHVQWIYNSFLLN